MCLCLCLCTCVLTGEDVCSRGRLPRTNEPHLHMVHYSLGGLQGEDEEDLQEFKLKSSLFMCLNMYHNESQKT